MCVRVSCWCAANVQMMLYTPANHSLVAAPSASPHRFQHVLEVSGINAALRARGISAGDTVVLGDTEFEWSDEQTEGAMYGAWLQDMKDRRATRKGKSAWPSGRPSGR